MLIDIFNRRKSANIKKPEEPVLDFEPTCLKHFVNDKAAEKASLRRTSNLIIYQSLTILLCLFSKRKTAI